VYQNQAGMARGGRLHNKFYKLYGLAYVVRDEQVSLLCNKDDSSFVCLLCKSCQCRYLPFGFDGIFHVFIRALNSKTMSSTNLTFSTDFYHSIMFFS